jgi:hypothetical protein
MSRFCSVLNEERVAIQEQYLRATPVLCTLGMEIAQMEKLRSEEKDAGKMMKRNGLATKGSSVEKSYRRPQKTGAHLPPLALSFLGRFWLFFRF